MKLQYFKSIQKNHKDRRIVLTKTCQLAKNKNMSKLKFRAGPN